MDTKYSLENIQKFFQDCQNNVDLEYPDLSKRFRDNLIKARCRKYVHKMIQEAYQNEKDRSWVGKKVWTMIHNLELNNLYDLEWLNHLVESEEKRIKDEKRLGVHCS